MADELQSGVGVKTNMVPGDKGVFDVFVDDSLVFSMSDTGRFPKSGEILAMFQQ